MWKFSSYLDEIVYALSENKTIYTDLTDRNNELKWLIEQASQVY